MTYGKYKDTLIKNGYSPLPIIPNKKAPAVPHWTSDDYAPPPSYNNYGVGIRCGVGAYPIVAIDCDITNIEIAKKMSQYILQLCGETVYRVGNAPKTVFLYRAEKEGIKKKFSLRYDIGCIEICGQGQQVVAFGTHPGTKRPYTWPGVLDSILNISADQLTIVSEDDIQKIIQHFETVTEQAGHKALNKNDKLPNRMLSDADSIFDIKNIVGLTENKAKELLSVIDPDSHRDIWINTGMALHYEFAGSDIGLTLWEDWSAGGEKYKEGEPARLWSSFGKYDGKNITAAYLLKQAKTHQENQKAKNYFDRLNWSIRRFDKNPPEIPMIIDGFLPRGIVSLFYSAGGAGKSTLVLYMSICIAIAKRHKIRFLGHDIKGGPVAIITSEDPDLILNRRFIAIATVIAEELDITLDEVQDAVSESLFIISTFGDQVHFFETSQDKTKLHTTSYYDSLVESMKAIPDLQLIVIDTKSRYSPSEGLGNVMATQEMTYYEKLALNTDASVMLLHHTNKASRDGQQSGAQAYRDVTGFFDSARAAWYLRGLTAKELNDNEFTNPNQGTYLYLENAKNSYLPVNEPMILNRKGYRYIKKKGGKKLSNTERKEKFDDAAYNKVLHHLQSCDMEELSQATILRVLKSKEGLSRRLVLKTLGALEEDSLICKDNQGYKLTKEGLVYGLSIGKE